MKQVLRHREPTLYFRLTESAPIAVAEVSALHRNGATPPGTGEQPSCPSL
jgi:hypothetical protein